MSQAAEQMMYEVLSGDATLTGLAPGGVWRNVAPSSAEGTIVLVNPMTGDDTYALAGRAYTGLVFQVKAITPGESAVPAWDAAERVEALLTDQPLTLEGGRVLMCRRQSVISLTEVDAGDQYQHAGGIYQLMVQE